MDVLADPVGARWFSHWKYNPLVAGTLWEPVANGSIASTDVGRLTFVTGTPSAVPVRGDSLVVAYRNGNVLAHTHVDAVVPAGAIDGTNRVFTLPSVPSPRASLSLWKNAIRLRRGPNADYALLGATITMVQAQTPASGDKLIAHYATSTASTHTHVENEIPTGVIDGVNATFTLASAPDPPESLELFLHGRRMYAGEDYTLAGATITFMAGSIPIVGTNLRADYRTTAASSHAHVWQEIPLGPIDGANAIFDLMQLPSPLGSIRVWKNGLRMANGGNDYTESAATLSTALMADGSFVRVHVGALSEGDLVLRWQQTRRAEANGAYYGENAFFRVQNNELVDVTGEVTWQDWTVGGVYLEEGFAFILTPPRRWF